MNWYRQSMALPEVKNPYPPLIERRKGLQYVDEHLSEEKARELSEPEMEWLASGQHGSAFAFNDKNIVKKLTRDYFEAETARKIMSRQKNKQPIPGFVYVYDVKDLSSDSLAYYKSNNPDKTVDPDDNQLFQLTIEKVKPLSDREKQLFSNHFGAIAEIIETSSGPRDDVDKYVMEQFKFKTTDNDKKFLMMLINFVRIIDDNAYIDTDIFYENVGVRNNAEIVILDLGSMELPS